ncbi:MAG: hypothetical protein ABIK65_10785 [Candidatus Eisenbacteria bacterium]
MKRPPSRESTFIVSRRIERDDLPDWVADHPSIVGDGFEVLASWVPLPDGDEIPLLGACGGGGLCVVDVLGNEWETFYRLGRVVAFLRSRAAWLRRAFPERELDADRALRIVMLGDDFPPPFIDAMAGLAVYELVLLRIRDLESTDGRRLLLVEREESRMRAPEEAPRRDAFTEEEEEFFRRLETERENLRSRKEAG